MCFKMFFNIFFKKIKIITIENINEGFPEKVTGNPFKCSSNLFLRRLQFSKVHINKGGFLGVKFHINEISRGSGLK